MRQIIHQKSCSKL